MGTAYTENLFVGAITNGAVIAAGPLTIKMQCGNEKLSTLSPNFINLAYVINTGTYKWDLPPYPLFTSTIDFSICPIVSYVVEPHD